MGKDTRIKPVVASWGIPLKEIYENEGVRLDASHYNRLTRLARKQLKQSKYPLKPLSEAASLTLPGQFVRVWAKSAEYGIQYVNASDLMAIEAFGALGENTRFLSHVSEVDMDELKIKSGWLVVTCSGTIGRVFYIPTRLDGCVATHDLIRVIPDKGVPVGYLHAYISSPLSQAQILGHTHGGQIDHITDDQLGSILVPILPDPKMKDIHNRTMQALRSRETAVETIAQIAAELQSSLKK